MGRILLCCLAASALAGSAGCAQIIDIEPLPEPEPMPEPMPESVCGDGIWDIMAGEACDDGNTESGDACSADCSSVDVGGDGGGACGLDVAAERTPGFPYDVGMMKNEVLPMLQVSCGSAGCHAPDNATSYTVWPDDPSDPQKCNFARSFNAVHDNSDLLNPRNSKLITAVDGTLAAHPIELETEDPKMALMLAYIENASAAREAAGGGSDTSHYFDADVFATVVQPTFDRANCAASGCHDLATAQGGFGITAGATAGSLELAANLQKVAGLVTLGAGAGARASKIHIYATNEHAGAVVDDVPGLEDWIAKGIAAAGDVGGDGPVAGCVDTARFNPNVFRDEVLPVLTGDIDLNNRDGGTSTGCVRGPCHGTDRGPGSFYIDLTRPIDENLKSISCFVDLVDPSASQVLGCPLGLGTCAKPAHPGTDIFFGADDLNYQKLLSYIYVTNNESTPRDFAFFARNINPLFNDENAVQDGALGLTCADTTACHGVQIATEPPPSRANFGIIPNSTDPRNLLLSFVATSSFTHFRDAAQSSLLMYPTNELANVDNPLATGLPHPGGEDFAASDAEALTIFKSLPTKSLRTEYEASSHELSHPPTAQKAADTACVWNAGRGTRGWSGAGAVL